MTVTDRELSWITEGTLLAVTINGHRYRGTATGQTTPDRWNVEILTWGGEEAGYRHTPSGIYECGRNGPHRIEHILGPPYHGRDTTMTPESERNTTRG